MRRLYLLLAAGVLMLAAACQPAAPIAGPANPPETAPAPAVTIEAAAIPTLSQRSTTPPAAPAAQITAEARPLTSTPFVEAESPVMPIAEITAPTATQPAPCTLDHCRYQGALFLSRPIQPPGNDDLDITYRFGTTQGRLRDPHHGVEFLNAYGTPVVAAGDGRVVVAGTDMDPTSERGVWPITYYGPYSNFYGNLVVIEHPAPLIGPEPLVGMPLPVYTLYGHLSEVSVQVGQEVTAGQQIGKVGQAGIATGPHLHFEVRLGENSYKAARNPELWLGKPAGGSVPERGALAGAFLDSYSNYEAVESIVVEHMPDGPEGAPGKQAGLITYEESGLIGQAPWQESFAAGDLEPGWYRISFPMDGLRQEIVQVLAGQVTVVTFYR